MHSWLTSEYLFFLLTHDQHSRTSSSTPRLLHPLLNMCHPNCAPLSNTAGGTKQTETHISNITQSLSPLLLTPPQVITQGSGLMQTAASDNCLLSRILICYSDYFLPSLTASVAEPNNMPEPSVTTARTQSHGQIMLIPSNTQSGVNHLWRHRAAGPSRQHETNSLCPLLTVISPAG